MSYNERTRRAAAADGWWALRSSARHHLLSDGKRTVMVPHAGRRSLLSETIAVISGRPE